MRERLLGVSLSLQAIDTRVADAAAEVTTVDEPPVAPTTPPPGSTMLVVQADGTGVPMVPPSPVAPPVRLGTGQQRPQQQEAGVTSLSTVAPDPRAPQAIVAAWLAEGDRPATAARPAPVGKDLHATLEGQEVARMRLAPRAGQREGAQIPPRVARTEGAEAWQEPVVTHVPGLTLVLAIIHGAAYLWATAHTVWGETHRHRTRWVRAYLEPLRRGATDAVIAAVEDAANDPT